MTRRLTALILCLIMLATLPLSAFASQVDTTTPAMPSSVRYVPSGEIIVGTATLYDAAGNQLPIEYAYSSRITISQSIAGQLAEKLSDCGFQLPVLEYNYQLMNMQSFFVVRVTDGLALARIIDSMVNRTANTAPVTEVSSSDRTSAAISDSDVSSSDVSSSDVSATDTVTDTQPDDTFAPIGNQTTDAPPASTTSLHALLFGSATFDAYPTLEASIANAFPEFTFEKPVKAPLPQTLNYVSGVALAPDGMTAQVAVLPEPEYVEREVFGEVFQVLMVSNVAYSYELSSYNISGATDGAVIPEQPAGPVIPSDTDTTEPTTAPTTTTTATTTTTTTTSASATQSATATTTTTTTTTTTENNGKFPCEGYVSTRRMRLNVRSGPGTDYKIITKISKGTTLTVLDYDEKAEWYKVKLSDGTIGWCTAEYITLK